MLQKGGIKVGIITGRRSVLLQRRAEELAISPLVQGREDKWHALNEMMVDLNVSLEEIAFFVGDDLPDLAVIKQVGLGITPANGSHIVARQADWQTKHVAVMARVREDG